MPERIIKWNLSNTYKQTPRKLIEDILIEAFYAWTLAVDNIIIFVHKMSYIDEDLLDPNFLLISFYSGYHNDKHNFDGPGGVLAHSRLQSNIHDKICLEIHFDAEENWIFVETFDNFFSKNPVFYNICVHEIGHALGLRHNDNFSSIMYPKYSRLNYAISELDANNVKKLFNIKIDNRNPKLLTELNSFMKYHYIEILYLIFIYWLYCVIL